MRTNWFLEKVLTVFDKKKMKKDRLETEFAKVPKRVRQNFNADGDVEKFRNRCRIYGVSEAAIKALEN